MKLHLKISVLLLLIITTNMIFGQGQALNHRKYWWYKTRLNNDFVKVGLNAGESLPFNQRGKDGPGFINANSNMNIGDGTSTLGLYIAVLATEYKLLEKNQQNTDRVKHELFCALNAIDRLDYKAENIEQNGIFRLNGFFIRDDTPKNFIKSKINYEHFNYYSDWDGVSTVNSGDPSTYSVDRGFHSKCEAGMFKVSSSWATAVDENDLSGLYKESQDQVYDILLGLAFVNKFVPQGTTDNYTAFPYTAEIDIRQQARNQAKRLIDYIRDPKDYNGNDCNASAWDKLVNSWRINNPITCNQIPTAEGGDARIFAYPLGESECQITSNSFSAPNSANLLAIPQACPGSGYHNVYSSTSAFAVWNQIATTPLYNPNNPSAGIDNRVFIANLSSICNCIHGSVADQLVQQTITNLQQIPIFGWFGTILGWVWKLVTTLINVLIPGLYTNITSSAITTNAYRVEAPLDHAPIAHALLHGYNNYAHNPQYSFDYLLDVAPCNGIYNFGSDQSHYQWSSDNRCEHPNRRGLYPGSPSAAPSGEYNGIDYMLYHNLYYLYQSSPIGINVNVTDLSNIYINQPTNLGCNNVNAYETITTENTNITCTSQSVWRAGKTIYFGGGTSITGNGSSTSGPNFHAYIKKFDCASDYGVFKMANSDSTIEENTKIDEDSYAKGAKYHTVNYPADEGQVMENNDREVENLITELPEDPIEKLMKEAYPTYSKELFIKPTLTNDVVKAYFTLDDDETAFINVVDMSGKTVYSNHNIKSDDSGLTIDLSNYASGTYILKFTSTKGTNKTEKIIKQ